MWSEVRVKTDCSGEEALIRVRTSLANNPRFRGAMRNYGGHEYAASLGGGIATFGEIVVVRIESEEAGRCILQVISQTSQWFDWGRTKGNVEYLINSLQRQGMTCEPASSDSGHAIGRVARAMPSPPEMPS